MRATVQVFGLVGILGLLAGCVETHYVAVPTEPALPVTPGLQDCAQHAAMAQEAQFGGNFNGLQLNNNHLVVTAPSLPIGSQPVGLVYDGEGQWYGTQEQRKVRFHCMISPAGKVVYSFVRAE